MTTLLQPEDSKRVADAIIAAVENADFDVAYEIRAALNPGNQLGLGIMGLDTLYRAVVAGIENCIGSQEFGRIVQNAIIDGVEAAQRK
jgi:hypothetical protein